MQSNKKLLTVLIVLLLMANVATIAIFWFKNEDRSSPKNGGPAKFIIKELSFDKKQQEKFLALANEHQEAIKLVRLELKDAKEAMFDLLSEHRATNADKEKAIKTCSIYTEKIDSITLDHFTKVRAICNSEQQKKFDGIIKNVAQMIGGQNQKERNARRGPASNESHGNGAEPPSERPNDMPPTPPNN